MTEILLLIEHLGELGLLFLIYKTLSKPIPLSPPTIIRVSKEKTPAQTPVGEDYEILTSEGTFIGRRPHGHPDLKEALSTRGLCVRTPDGTIEEGTQ